MTSLPLDRMARKLAALLWMALATSLLAQNETAATLDGLLARMPVNTVAEKDALDQALIKLGEPGVRVVFDNFNYTPQQ